VGVEVVTGWLCEHNLRPLLCVHIGGVRHVCCLHMAAVQCCLLQARVLVMMMCCGMMPKHNRECCIVCVDVSGCLVLCW
jgi:hypothetical protein